MSGLFNHNVVPYKPGFIFIVAPVVHDDPESVEISESVARDLNDNWEKMAKSGLTVAEVRDEEEAEIIYADAITLLDELDSPFADNLVISSVLVIGDACVVHCSLCDEEDEDEDDDTLDDSDFE